MLVLPLVFLPEANAAWLVREDAELAPLVTPAPSQEPAPQTAEEKLADPQQPKGADEKCAGCPNQTKEGCSAEKSKEGCPAEQPKEGCPAMQGAKTGSTNATKPMDGNATKDMAELMATAVAFRVESLVQTKPDDPKVVELVGAKLDDKNVKVRGEAVAVLGLLSAYYPEKAGEVFPYLFKAANDSDAGVHAAVLKAMLPTIPHLQEKSAVPMLKEALTKGNSTQRAAVAAIVANLADKLPWLSQLSDSLIVVIDDPQPRDKACRDHGPGFHGSRLAA